MKWLQFLQLLAEALNDAGETFTDGNLIRLDVDFTKENLKESLWDKVQQAMYPLITSSAKLSTVEISAVYEQVNRFTAERTAVSVAWPEQQP